MKSHGREVATRVFERRRDAVAWEQEQRRALRSGEWFDPRRGRIPLSALYPEWSRSRAALKRTTREADESAWRNHIEPRFGCAPLTTITRAQVAHWVGGRVEGGCSAATANRYLSTHRSMLAFALADGRLARNVATGVPLPRGAKVRREGQFLTVDELHALTAAATGRYAELVTVLGLCGLRWGELAGLQVGDVVRVPGPGLRLQRAVLASSHDGGLYVDSLKGRRARTVPLPATAHEVVQRWADGRAADEWLFAAPEGWTPQRVELEAVDRLVAGHRRDRAPHPPTARPPAHRGFHLARCRRRPQGRPTGPRARLRCDDDGPLRPPHRQEPLGGGRPGRGHTGGTSRPPRQRKGPLDRSREGLTCAEALEPPKGIEPLTYSLRVNRSGRLS